MALTESKCSATKMVSGTASLGIRVDADLFRHACRLQEPASHDDNALCNRIRQLLEPAGKLHAIAACILQSQ
jgi:hypothetical protein